MRIFWWSGSKGKSKGDFQCCWSAFVLCICVWARISVRVCVLYSFSSPYSRFKHLVEAFKYQSSSKFVRLFGRLMTSTQNTLSSVANILENENKQQRKKEFWSEKKWLNDFNWLDIWRVWHLLLFIMVIYVMDSLNNKICVFREAKETYSIVTNHKKQLMINSASNFWFDSGKKKFSKLNKR